MKRLTVRNSEGIAVLKTPYQCDRCGEEIYRLSDYGNGEPIEKLARYEDLEEQGKLPKLPCAVGDTVYVIPSETNYKLNIINGHSENNRVYEQVVNRIEISKSGFLLLTCDGMASVIDKF